MNLIKIEIKIFNKTIDQENMISIIIEIEISIEEEIIMKIEFFREEIIKKEEENKKKK